MHLTTLWFALIVVLWVGYFVLEGFDFGVGILLPVLGKDETDRRRMYRSLGPVWDGTEVWLLVAGGATFAAFPEWYASLFSGFYLALLLILCALIVRGVAIEYRNKRPEADWRRRWDFAMTGSSGLAAFLWGVAFANIVRGVPLDRQHQFTGTLLTLLNPYALLGGLVTLTLFALHGAVFLTLRTDDGLHQAALRAAQRLGVAAVVVAAPFLALTQLWYVGDLGLLPGSLVAGVAAVCLIAAVVLVRAGRTGWAFTATAATLLLAVVTLFLDLWPNVLPSTTAPGNSLTVRNAASSPYTLGVMTWVTAFATPVVLAYQAWTYWVFRGRISRADVADPVVPLPEPRGPQAASASVRT